ncbi:SDR family NAD(P)-dependent oxidoreductase [Bacillus sp. YC2]|nr:SDR family NAD(P)-dependent oxidoreductase [Bacillus sp. YC2]
MSEGFLKKGGKEHTAIITGASRGIGKVIAEQLARLGIKVAVNYANHSEQAEAVVIRMGDRPDDSGERRIYLDKKQPYSLRTKAVFLFIYLLLV